jgi:ribonuclease E
MRYGAWSVAIVALACGCSSVNPHYEPTATLASASITPGPALAQGQTAPQTASTSQTVSSTPTVNPSQNVSPWREDGTRVYSAAKPPVTSLHDAMAAAHSTPVPQAAPISNGTATQVAMKPVASPAMPAPVASPYALAPALPIASRAPATPSLADSLATQAIQQTGASAPATPTDPKSTNQSSERIRITSVAQDAGPSAPPEQMSPNPPPPR